jgi:DNA-binding NtrC family response regulator
MHATTIQFPRRASRECDEGLTEGIPTDHGTTGPERTIASESLVIRTVLEHVRQVSPTPATVLLLGETGVGKELFAKAIHEASPRRHRAMITVNCAAMPAALIESELFGHERGAFTDASFRRIGRFEAAHRSTILLDEIGELPLEVQVKLLRVLEERTVERLGGNHSLNVDVRIIAATNRDLEQAVATRTFREDLFYRLNVFPLTIPPLRDRREDIPHLVRTFVDEFAQAFGKRIDGVGTDSLAALQEYEWPGNVRELRHTIERAVIVATGPTLTIKIPPRSSRPGRSRGEKLVDISAEHIRGVLDSCGWRVRGVGGAAERLAVKPTTLESRMMRLGIARSNRPATTTHSCFFAALGERCNALDCSMRRRRSSSDMERPSRGVVRLLRDHSNHAHPRTELSLKPPGGRTLPLHDAATRRGKHAALPAIRAPSLDRNTTRQADRSAVSSSPRVVILRFEVVCNTERVRG